MNVKRIEKIEKGRNLDTGDTLNGDMMHISISSGNSKMGAIPSISLPPVTTCRHDAPCVKKCYARRIYCRRPSVHDAYERNLSIYRADPKLFFEQFESALIVNTFFRLNVSGDFPDYDYFTACASRIRKQPHCKVLAFTKQFEIVNRYIYENGALPSNFTVIFSTWGNWKPYNPFDLPESAVIFRTADHVPGTWKICGGNCFDCACRGCGCWELKNGETIAFREH